MLSRFFRRNRRTVTVATPDLAATRALLADLAAADAALVARTDVALATR